jgi:uncharacterized membrane protein
MDTKTTTKKPAAQSESIVDLLKQIALDSAKLLRQEVALAKLEFRGKVRSLRTGLMVAALGAACALIGLATVWAAFVVWLTNFLPPGIAAAVSGGGLVMIGAIIIILGLKLLQKPFDEPGKSVETLTGRT